ncbi:bifunctional glycosyltransferase/CDP-glycerol:glycerophosphate glycerophosphotransferase [Streptomyces varsoviensis]|nr:CDP-glycerol glycerophosphotransferase family protein [Streptomyces varsoviensis]
MSPRLTVVIPVHNGAQHLWECLASVAAQSLRELDVVVVDDGSTDAAPDIARAFAERDGRFRLVRQHNHGTGHARNTGVRHAAPGTEYLAFADSADVLPRRAYERLVGLLDGSGSDFATGNVYLLTAAGRSQAWQHRHLRRTRTATHITEDLGLLSDHTAWNKVFRRTFWDRHRLAFPEGVLYEDTPLTIPAHFLAEAVDVLHEHVYYWRVREGDGPRRRTGPRMVRDRIASVDHVSRFLADPANTRWSAYKRDYDRSVLIEDLPHFVDRLPTADTDYRAVFMDRARDWASRVDPELFKELPVDLRVKWQLIRERRLADLLAVLEYERRNAAGFLVQGLPLRKRAVLPGADGTPVPLPSSVTRLTSEDFPVRTGVREILWHRGKLVIRGYAYIRNLGAASRLRTLKTALVTSGRHRLLMPLRTVHMPEATHDSRQEQHCYDWSGFEITIDPERLAGDERWRPGRWEVDVVVAASGVVRRAPLRSLGTGSGAWPPPGELGDGTRLVPWFKKGRLLLSVEWAERRLTGHRAVGGGEIELDITDESACEPVALRLTHRSSGTVLETPVSCRLDDYEGVRATARIRLADLTAARPAPGEHPKEVRLRDTSSWDPVLVLADSRTARIATAAAPRPGRYPLADGRELIVAATADEHVVLHDRAPQPIADLLTWHDDGSLTVEGELPAAAPAELELVLRHSIHAAEVTFPCERRDADADGGARDGKGTASDEATGPAERPPAPGRAGPAAGCDGACACGGRAPDSEHGSPTTGTGSHPPATGTEHGSPTTEAHRRLPPAAEAAHYLPPPATGPFPPATGTGHHSPSAGSAPRTAPDGPDHHLTADASGHRSGTGRACGRPSAVERTEHSLAADGAGDVGARSTTEGARSPSAPDQAGGDFVAEGPWAPFTTERAAGPSPTDKTGGRLPAEAAGAPLAADRAVGPSTTDQAAGHFAPEQTGRHVSSDQAAGRFTADRAKDSPATERAGSHLPADGVGDFPAPARAESPFTTDQVQSRFAPEQAGNDFAPGPAGVPAPGDRVRERVAADRAGGRLAEGGPLGRRRFVAVLRPGEVAAASGTVPLREGRWYLFVRGRGGSARDARDAGEGMPVRLAPELFAGLPEARTVAGKTFTVDRRFHDRVFVEAGSAVPLADRGPYRQRLLRERTYPARAALPLRDTVLYSSFGGRRYSDSPRAVHEELVRRGADVEHLWVVRDRQFEVPPTARALILGSAEWYEALARSRRIVTNTQLPPWFRRREGQYVLQTWHGTPLKRIGADLAGTLCAELAPSGPAPDPGAQWSTLLSANPHSTRVFRRALGYHGEIAETGLPRTDALFAADRAERAAALRRRLGIPRGKRVVLYAPTQRDERAYDTGHYRLHLPLNVARAESALGADHVLLVRSHPLVADQVPARRGPFLRDVSAHPDAADVLLAADVLVTDYSSLAVDFANTGRPLLYLTPDLARFRDTVRGFTTDFVSEAPGPQLTGTDDLVDALRDVERVAISYAPAYRRFRAAYCPFDDGGAAARAVDGLLAATP